MKVKACLAVIGVALALQGLSAQQQGDKVQLPKSQVPNLGRPTKPDDVAPLLNFDDYFVGKWTFEWNVPEGPLGPAGTIAGTMTVKALEPGKFFEFVYEGTGPGGKFSSKEVFSYLRENRALTRWVTDGRGFSYPQAGTVGGDLGGYFNIYLESPAISYNGHQIRLKHRITLTSPIAYKAAVTSSVDGGPFLNYGNPWWKKDVPGVSR